MCSKVFSKMGQTIPVTDTHPEASTYMINMPNQLNIFHMFHTSELKMIHENNLILFPSHKYAQPGPIVTEVGLEEFKIDDIINAKCVMTCPY